MATTTLIILGAIASPFVFSVVYVIIVALLFLLGALLCLVGRALAAVGLGLSLLINGLFVAVGFAALIGVVCPE